MSERPFLDKLYTSQEKKLPENVIRIKKPEGIYRLVLSDSHATQESVSTVDGSDGVILEGDVIIFGDFNYSDPKIAKRAIETAARRDEQYKDIILWCQQNDKPIYYTDLQYIKLIPFIQKILRGLEFGVAANLLMRFGVNITKKPNNRRDFLKLTAGAFLATPTPARIKDSFATMTPFPEKGSKRMDSVVISPSPESSKRASLMISCVVFISGYLSFCILSRFALSLLFFSSRSAYWLLTFCLTSAGAFSRKLSL